MLREFRRIVRSTDQFAAMMVQDSQQLLIVDVPQRPSRLILSEKTEMGKQLPEAYIGRELAQLR